MEMVLRACFRDSGLCASTAQSRFGESSPEHLTVYGIKGLAEVDEGYV